MSNINYVKGDATDPSNPGPKIIAHICNDHGAWGRGFVLALGKRYPGAERAYRLWARKDLLDHDGKVYHPEMPPFELGWIQMVQVVQDQVFVANMIAQKGILPTPEGIHPIRYESLGQCLKTLSGEARGLQAAVHMPRIGCGLAGGEWKLVEPIVQRELCDQGVSVTVFDYEGSGPEFVNHR